MCVLTRAQRRRPLGVVSITVASPLPRPPRCSSRPRESDGLHVLQYPMATPEHWSRRQSHHWARRKPRVRQRAHAFTNQAANDPSADLLLRDHAQRPSADVRFWAISSTEMIAARKRRSRQARAALRLERGARDGAAPSLSRCGVDLGSRVNERRLQRGLGGARGRVQRAPSRRDIAALPRRCRNELMLRTHPSISRRTRRAAQTPRPARSRGAQRHLPNARCSTVVLAAPRRQRRDPRRSQPTRSIRSVCSNPPSSGHVRHRADSPDTRSMTPARRPRDNAHQLALTRIAARSRAVPHKRRRCIYRCATALRVAPVKIERVRKGASLRLSVN